MVAAETRWDAVGHPIGRPVHMAQPYYRARGTNSRFHDDDTQQAGLALDRGLNAFATPCAAKAAAEPLSACSPGDSRPSARSPCRRCASGMRTLPRPGPSRHDNTASLLGAVEYAPVFGPVMRLREFDERLPVVGQQRESLREPGGRCLTAGNGFTWSGRPYVSPSWNSEPAQWPVQVDTRGFLSVKFSPE